MLLSFYVIMHVFTIIPSESEIVIKLREQINVYGLIFHFLSAAAFIFGAHMAMHSYHYYGTKKKFYMKRPRLFSFLIYSYCIVGIGVVVWQISLSVSLTDYMRELATYIEVQDDSCEIRNYFLRTREAGGLPGIVKMFSYLPLSALYLVLAYMSIRDKTGAQPHISQISKSKKYVLAILITIFVRSIFTLDRIVLVAPFLILIYYAILSSKEYGRPIRNLRKKLLRTLAILTIFAAFLHVICSVRQSIGFKDVLAEYSSLGLANLSILFESNIDYTLGQNLSYAISFPLEYIGLADALFAPDKAPWVWNPARYLTAYAYQDFGSFCILFFFVFGFFTTIIHLKAWYKSNPYILIMLFALILCIATSIVVPIFRGPEWWASLLMAMVGMKLTCGRTSVTNPQEQKVSNEH